MEKVIYLYACDEPVTYSGTTLVAHRGRHDNEFNFVIAGDPVEQCVTIPVCLNTRVRDMVERVLSALGTEHTISKLRILSHGAPGTVSIGENIAARNQAQLAPLNGRFATGSEGAFLHGCRIASDAVTDDHIHVRSLDAGTCRSFYDNYDNPGFEFAQHMRGHFSDRLAHEAHGVEVSGSIGFTFICNLARTLGVNVTAAVDRQTDIVIASHGHRVDSTGYEGQYVTVTPAGTHTLHTGTPLRRVFDATCSPYAPE